MNRSEFIGCIVRYGILLAISLSGLLILYIIFSPLTIYPSFWLIHAQYPDAVLLGTNTIFFKGYYAEIVSACVAGAAYYLLLILNLTTPMPIKKRIPSLIFAIVLFLVLNIARIVLFARLFEIGYNYFDVTHLMSWYFGSTVLVIIVWFTSVKLFHIDEIPIYSDVMNILKDIR